MYAVGHFALGYLTGKLSSTALRVKINIPLLFLASVLPDVDFLIPGLEHRGPLHSLVVGCMFVIPFVIVYKQKVIPYFVALLQHSLIGDYVTGGSQLLWPFSQSLYGIDTMVKGLPNIAVEWLVFVVAIFVMFKSKDMMMLFSSDLSNLVLFVPFVTVLLPTVATFPLYFPWALLVPHLVFVVIFTYSVYMTLKSAIRKNGVSF